jgi:hypothetical protein
VREYRLPSVDEGFSPGIVETKIDTMPGPAVTVVTPERSPAPAAQTAPVSAVATPAQSDAGKPVVAAVNQTDTPGQVADMVPMLGGSGDGAPEYSPAARAIAANLAAVKANAPQLVQLLERVPGMESIMNPPERTQAVDPLSRVQSPSDSRRTSRLLASALPTLASYSVNEDSGDRAMVDRVSRSLTEDRLYDSISRFGVKADRVAIKF